MLTDGEIPIKLYIVFMLNKLTRHSGDNVDTHFLERENMM